MFDNKKNKWYSAGLHFECSGCGNCCSGPQEGFIWVTKKEIQFICEFLKMSIEEFRENYTKKIGLKTSLIEESVSKDCIFLKRTGAKRQCSIYPVRPNQCRTWPFWSQNLESPHSWNQTTIECPGINRGKQYSFEDIERLRKQKKWWTDEKDK